MAWRSSRSGRKVVAVAETWQQWSLQQSPLPFTGASSNCRCCNHSYFCPCRHFRRHHHCHDRHLFFCCHQLLIIVAIAIPLLPLPSPSLLPLSSLSPLNLPLPLLLLVECCLYPSAAINASSSSPCPLSLRRPTPVLVTTSATTSPPPTLPPSLLPCIVHQPLSSLAFIVHPSPLVVSSAVLVVLVNFVVG